MRLWPPSAPSTLDAAPAPALAGWRAAALAALRRAKRALRMSEDDGGSWVKPVAIIAASAAAGMGGGFGQAWLRDPAPPEYGNGLEGRVRQIGEAVAVLGEGFRQLQAHIDRLADERERRIVAVDQRTSQLADRDREIESRLREIEARLSAQRR